MKSKASLVVLLAEIIAIVILHSARSTQPETEKPGITHTQSATHIDVSSEKQPVLFTTLR